MIISSNGPVEGFYLVTVSGPLNSAQARALIQTLRDIPEHGVAGVVLNLQDVPFVDGPGLSALIAGHEMFGSDGRHFYLAGIQNQPRIVFELTGFDHIFEIADGLTGISIDGKARSPMLPIGMSLPLLDIAHAY